MSAKRRSEPSPKAAKKVKANENQDLCTKLAELAEFERNHKLGSGVEAQGLPGVGKGIAEKIDEILISGTTHKLEEEKEDPDLRAVELFNEVQGIGPTMARRLVYKYGCHSLDDLKQKDVPLTSQQQMGLKYFDAMQQMVPRAEVQEIEQTLANTLKKVDEKATLTICGGYRRGLQEIKEVDALFMHPEFKGNAAKKSDLLLRMVEQMKAEGLIVDDFAEGCTKYLGLCVLPKEGSIPRRCNFRLVPSDSFWTELLYMTGSDLFNVEMRTNARKKGFLLSEYGLWKGKKGSRKGTRIPVDSEEAVFTALGMDYVLPEGRSL
eukprot:GGOE01047513.1.p1 GENE.GGOE01047513.1~~GGOE01047513.1.p1  ORF type:complete len:333 (-),score=99.68 GGOE01047513.1:381-1343(-)